MEIKKPDLIDFEKLKSDCYKFIHESENERSSIIRLINIKAEEREQAIKDKKRVKENELTIELSDLNRALIEADKALEMQNKQLKEYELRCLDLDEIKEIEYNDFIKNFDSVFTEANIHSKNDKIPQNLRDHLMNVLNLEVSKFDKDQKVAYFLSLKTEVKMCQNYLDSTKI
jgi:hypothetical protein